MSAIAAFSPQLITSANFSDLIYRQFHLMVNMCTSTVLREDDHLGVFRAGFPERERFFKVVYQKYDEFGGDANALGVIDGEDNQENMEKNLDLMFKLAELGYLQNYFGYRNGDTGNCFKTSGFGHRLPYQLQYEDRYIFDVGRCGHFGTGPKYELVDFEGMVAKRHRAAHERGRFGMDAPDKFYFVEQLCPNWRLLCGAQNPPNLPDHLKTCAIVTNLPPANAWVQLPRNRTKIPDTWSNWEYELLSGRLPSGEDPEMQWVSVAPDNLVCSALDLHKAKYVVDNSPHSSMASPECRDSLIVGKHTGQANRDLAKSIGNFGFTDDGYLFYAPTGDRYRILTPTSANGPPPGGDLKTTVPVIKLRARAQQLASKIFRLNQDSTTARNRRDLSERNLLAGLLKARRNSSAAFTDPGEEATKSETMPTQKIAPGENLPGF